MFQNESFRFSGDEKKLLANKLWCSNNHATSSAVVTKPSLFVYRFVECCGLLNRMTSIDGYSKDGGNELFTKMRCI